MAVCGFLVVVALKALLANGFGFSVAPFQMELQIPAGGPGPFQPSPISPISFGGPSPLMSMMSFPPIFNPMEAMGREEMDADSRMDVNGPMGNVTTKNKTESKDGFKVTTITSDGPGFHSYIKEYEKEGNSSGNATGPAGPPPDIGKLLSSGKIFDIMNQLRNMGKRPAKCKKCGSGKFCDPIFHLCRKKFAEGRTCMAQKQCGANLRCQWGKCQKAKKGDPGTFCKGNNQCNGDSCCRNTPGSFHLMCIPPQTEGAICGLHERQESVAKLFYVVKRSTVPTCSPCKSGLKCANTGDSKFKRCVKAAYAAKVANEEQEEEEEGSGEEEGEMEEDEGLPSDSVVDNPLQPQTQAQQQKQLTVTSQREQQQQQQQSLQAEQQQQVPAARAQTTSYPIPQKPIQGVFEGSVKPPKPETSSAKPMGPLHKSQPNQPKDPTGSGDENGSGEQDEEDEDGEEEKEKEEGNNNEDGKKEEKKEKENEKEEEEEEEEESGDSGNDLPSSDLPIPTKEEQKQNLQQQKKKSN